MQLKSLPTALTTKQFDALLSTLPKSATVNRRDSTIRVTAMLKGEQTPTCIISAARPDQRKQLWHVMAAPGLIEANAA